jgi:hypothetical protein
MIEDETATPHSKDIGVDHDRKKQSLNCILINLFGPPWESCAHCQIPDGLILHGKLRFYNQAPSFAKFPNLNINLM